MLHSAHPSRTVGAAPQGASDPDSAARSVQAMFGSIAHRYDLLNHVLSFNVDRYWWWRAARTFTHILRRSDGRVLDLCCGTGDMSRALLARAGDRGARMIIGADFSHPMLQRARSKFVKSRLHWIEADALRTPLPDSSFDLVTTAFGFRNLADYDAGLREIYRLLRDGGEVGILDFGEPSGLLGRLYRFYFRRVLPRLGTLISGVRGPYTYLPASVARFPLPAEMLQKMRSAGFRDLSWIPYTFGIAALYRGRKLGGASNNTLLR